MNWGRLSEPRICGNPNTAKNSLNYTIVNMFRYQGVVGRCYGCLATAAGISVVTTGYTVIC